MKKSRKFLLVSGLGVAAGAAILTFLKKRKEGKKYFEEYEDEMYLDFSGDVTISFEEAEKKATNFASEKFGSGVALVSASDEKAVVVCRDGQSIHCYLFGAVSDNMMPDSKTLLLYVNASTGEVFESENAN